MVPLLLLIGGAGLLSMFVYLIVLLLVVGLVYWIITQIPLPEPIKRIAIIIVVVVAAIVLIMFLLNLVGGGGGDLNLGR